MWKKHNSFVEFLCLSKDGVTYSEIFQYPIKICDLNKNKAIKILRKTFAHNYFLCLLLDVNILYSGTQNGPPLKMYFIFLMNYFLIQHSKLKMKINL